MPIGVRAAKRGLPPIPAFGIGWLYPVCPRRANLAEQSRPIFIPTDEVLPHNATDTEFAAHFAGNGLSVPGFAHGATVPTVVSRPFTPTSFPHFRASSITYKPSA